MVYIFFNMDKKAKLKMIMEIIVVETIKVEFVNEITFVKNNLIFKL